MTAPPSRTLPPLTSSLLPNAAQALARRERPQEAPSVRAPQRGASDIFDQIGEDDDEAPLVIAEATRPVVQNHSNKLKVSAPDSAPATAPRQRVQESTGFKKYTLGQLVEMIRQRKTRSRMSVQSGDLDGDEPEIDEDDILSRSRSARRRP